MKVCINSGYPKINACGLLDQSLGKKFLCRLFSRKYIDFVFLGISSYIVLGFGYRTTIYFTA